MVGVGLPQLGDRAEAPGDAGRLHAGAARRLHVDAGVAHVEHVGFGCRHL